MHEDLRVDRFELIHGTAPPAAGRLCRGRHRRRLARDPGRDALLDFDDPWDFEEVYGKLLDFARGLPFDPEAEDYLVHITTGTHVAQICLFLLTEARDLPGRLLQTQPPRRRRPSDRAGSWSVIDLDLSRYDSIATRFAAAAAEGSSFLKSGIETRNAGLQPADRRDRAGRPALARADAADGADRVGQVAARPPHLRAEAAEAPGRRATSSRSIARP